MKRLILLFMLVPALFLMACTPSERIVPETDPEATTWTEIDATVLAAKLAAGDDFILIVSSSVCLSCLEFQPILETFISTYGIIVYKIESGGEFPVTNAVFPYEFTPTIAVFAAGELLVSVNPADQPRPFETIEKLVDYLDQYVQIPN